MNTPTLVCIIIAAWLAFSPAQAATPEEVQAAKDCMAIEQTDESKFGRAEWHRARVRCLQELYILVGVVSGEQAVADEVRARLDALEQAYYASRSLCDVQNKKGSPLECYGTISLAPEEYRSLLRRMILAEDAGWVRTDPVLKEALEL